MDAFKEAMAIIGAIVGVLTSLLALYAKFLDVRRRAARDRRESAPAQVALAAAPRDTEPPFVIPVPDVGALARARSLVKGPATTLLIVGGVSLLANLFFAVFGYVDGFVTPLSTRTIEQRMIADAARHGDMAALAAQESERASSVMAIFTFLSFAVASAAAVWAGFGMLNLRSYWLSVAGSFAVMPGGCMCCLAGLPIGVWSLTVLLNPEVSAAFR
jgi:hypothetical protein